MQDTAGAYVNFQRPRQGKERKGRRKGRERQKSGKGTGVGRVKSGQGETPGKEAVISTLEHCKSVAWQVIFTHFSFNLYNRL